MDFPLSDSEKFRIDVALMDMEEHTVFSYKVRLIYLQLPCFTKREEDCESDFDRMIYVLKHMDVFDRMPWAAKDAVFTRLGEIAEVAALKPEERRQYETDVKHYRDTLAVMTGQFMQGEEKGRAEGRAEGICDTARNLKRMGLPIAVIIEATGLTETEIEGL